MTNPAPQLFTNGVLSHTIYQTCQKNLLFVQTIKFHYLTSFLVLPLFEQGDYLRKNLSIFLYTWTNKTPQSLSKTNLCVVSFHRGKFRYSTPSRALEVRQWKLVTASYIQNGLKKKTMTSCTTRKPEYLSIFWRRRILEYSKHATHRWHGIRARSCEEYRKYIEYGIQKKKKRTSSNRIFHGVLRVKRHRIPQNTIELRILLKFKCWQSICLFGAVTWLWNYIHFGFLEVPEKLKEKLKTRKKETLK